MSKCAFKKFVEDFWIKYKKVCRMSIQRLAENNEFTIQTERLPGNNRKCSSIFAIQMSTGNRILTSTTVCFYNHSNEKD